MKFKPISTKKMLVADGFYLHVSRHFFYTYFGVRGRYDTIAKTGVYINTGTPGTGFFARETDSHSYRRFVCTLKKTHDQNLFTLLFHKEFSFPKELAIVEAALKEETNPVKIQVLSAYQSALFIAKDEELLERIVRAIKDKIGQHPKKYLISILSHYKSRISNLEHEVKGAQFDIKNHMSETAFAEWGKVIRAFIEMANSRRIWQVETINGESSYTQVFFDMGIFNFIQSPYDTPIIRTTDGTCFYLFPTGIAKVRSSVDFDFFPKGTLHFEFNVTDISTLTINPEQYLHSKRKKKHHQPTDALSTLYGNTHAQEVGCLSIPELGITFLISHPKQAADFVDAIKKFKEVPLNETTLC